MEEHDDILAAVQLEPPITENEDQGLRKGVRAGVIALIIALMVMVLSEVFAFHKPVDFGKFALLFLFAAVWDITEARYLSNKKRLAKGIVEAVITVAALILYIGGLLR